MHLRRDLRACLGMVFARPNSSLNLDYKPSLKWGGGAN